ncbi:MAG: YopX family protein [Flavobacteriaceae bacterium]|jgi:hypothetical protein|nr:YopX family protein [Flavobacteriaceae bacterium]
MKKLKKTDKDSLKHYYEMACFDYLKVFCAKHDFYLSNCHWIGEKVGEIVGVADYFFDMPTIITDIDLDVPEEELLKHYDYCLDMMELKEPTPNFSAWAKGCPRYSKEKILEMKAEVEKEHSGWRAKGLDGEWKYGNFRYEYSVPFLKESDDGAKTDDVKIDFATRGQCVGERDKNGNVIFEGDVLVYVENDPYRMIDKGDVGEVIWEEKSRRFGFLFKSERKEYCLFCAGIDGTVLKWNDFEIVGNVVDNPKQKKFKRNKK